MIDIIAVTNVTRCPKCGLKTVTISAKGDTRIRGCPCCRLYFETKETFVKEVKVHDLVASR